MNTNTDQQSTPSQTFPEPDTQEIVTPNDPTEESSNDYNTSRSNDRPNRNNRHSQNNGNYQGNSNFRNSREDNYHGRNYNENYRGGRGRPQRFDRSQRGNGSMNGNYNGQFNGRRRGRGRGRFNTRPNAPKELSQTNVYVTNIPEEWDDDILSKEFAEFGEIKSAAIIPTHNQSRIAFIDFAQKECAEKCVRELKTRIYDNLPDGQNIIAKPAFIKKPFNRSYSNSGRFNDSNSNTPNHHMNNRNHHMNTQNHHYSPASRGRNNSHSFRDNRNREMYGGSDVHGSDMSDDQQLVQQMGSDWGPSSRNQQHPKQRHNMNNQGPQQQQQIMVLPVQQQPNFQMPIMVDPQTGMQMQMPVQFMEVNGQVMQVVAQQPMVQPPMQMMTVQDQNGQWVQQMVPVQQQMPGGSMPGGSMTPGNPTMEQPNNEMFQMMHQQGQDPNFMMQQQQMQQHQMQMQQRPNQPPPGFSGQTGQMDGMLSPQEMAAHMQMQQGMQGMMMPQHPGPHEQMFQQFQQMEQQQQQQPGHDPCFQPYPGMQQEIQQVVYQNPILVGENMDPSGHPHHQ